MITAAGQGIGRAIAEMFAEQGATVIATDINENALAELSGVRTLLLDVRSTADIAAVSKEVGGVDVLVNCAGIVANGSILESTEEEWAASLPRF